MAHIQCSQSCCRTSLLCVTLLLPRQKYGNILQNPYHFWKNKMIPLRTTPEGEAQIFGRSVPRYHSMYNVHPLRNCLIYLRNPIHEIHVDKLYIGVIT